jgi:predicted PurR-regulated permease PerM
MTRDQFISLFFIALLLVIVYQVFLILSPFVRAIFWSAILAFGFYPLYEKLKKRLKVHETLAAAVMTVLIFLVVVPPVIVVIINLTGQAIELYQSTSAYVREGNLERLVDQIRTIPWIQKIEARVFQWDPLKQNAAEWVLNTTQSIGNFTAAQAATITKNVFLFGLNAAVMAILLFIFLKDGEKIYRFIYQMAPLAEKNKKSIFGQVNETFAAVIRGQLLTSLTQGFVAGIIFWILGIPVPIFFASGANQPSSTLTPPVRGLRQRISERDMMSLASSI